MSLRPSSFLSASLLVASLVASLALTGCAGAGDDGPEEPPRHSTSKAAQRSAAAEKARHAYVDPCSLLSKDERDLVAGSYWEPRETVNIYSSAVEFNSCRLAVRDSTLDATAMHYGYAVTDELTLGKYITDAREISDSKVTPFQGLGDRAYFIEDSVREAWVRQGDYTLFVWSADDAFSEGAAARVLKSMLGKVTPGMLEHPVELPGTCPAPTSRRVVAALGGKVVRAAGSDRHDTITCDYASSRKVLTVHSAKRPRKVIAKGYQVDKVFSESLGSEKVALSLVPKAISTLSPSEFGPYGFTYTLTPPRVISATLGSADPLGRFRDTPHYDQAAFRTLYSWWVRSQISQLRK
ncbi:DUF3558 domain-containing protein [Nocardioides jensenii]|uniref:DUF3558 domain-containing protein n=1 Tax=Nocardioides jensenii TaxID=1843 RepID=UPI00082DCFE9|nr:DUF3558 domain-containing protein [Nocardioides jensenii]